MTSRNPHHRRTQRPTVLLMAAALGCMGSAAVQAQVVGMPETQPATATAAPLRIGNIDVRPPGRVCEGYADNVTTAESGTGC